MKKITLIIIASLFFKFECSAQKYFALPPGYNKIITSENRPQLDGSPYLESNWDEGSIVMNSGDTIPIILLRYNFYSGEMTYKHKQVVYSIGAPEKIKSITIGSLKFIYLAYKDDNEQLKKNFFELVYPGKIKLLTLYYPSVLPSNYNPTMAVGNKNDQLVVKEQYYVQVNDSNIIAIDKKGDSYINALGELGPKIKDYVKQNRLSFNNKGDLMTITFYANTLIKWVTTTLM